MREDVPAATLEEGEEVPERLVLVGGDAQVDDRMLTYQYLRQLPEIAKGDANKVWVIPAELSGAMGRISSAFAPGREWTPPPVPESTVEGGIKPLPEDPGA